MTLLANRDELSFACLRIIYRKRKVRSVAKMLDMMYQYSASVAAVLLAQLALIVIILHHFAS